MGKKEGKEKEEIKVVAGGRNEIKEKASSHFYLPPT